MSALVKAYKAAKAADTATLVGDTEKAVQGHQLASDLFAQAAESSPPETKPVCLSLANHHKVRSQYLRNSQLRPQLQLNPQSPNRTEHSQVNLNQLQANALAQAQAQAQSQLIRGPRSLARAQLSHNAAFKEETTTELGNSVAVSIAAIGHHYLPEPKQLSASKAAGVATKAFVRAFEAASVAAKNGEPSESFYLVGSNRGGGPSDKNELAGLPQAIDAGARSAQASLSEYLEQLESQKQQHEEEAQAQIDRLRAENDKLRNQLVKHKQRWDELKQSARKRRDIEPGLELEAAATAL